MNSIIAIDPLEEGVVVRLLTPIDNPGGRLDSTPDEGRA